MEGFKTKLQVNHFSWIRGGWSSKVDLSKGGEGGGVIADV